VRGQLYNVYLITVDDSPTFVVPNTVFGIAGALAPPLLMIQNAAVVKDPDVVVLVLRTLSFNWTNLLVFDLANQRQAGVEDGLNKPWRPIPSGRMSTTEMRHWLMVALPAVLAYNHLALGVGAESSLLSVLTWLYNDLGGGDDHWLVRNLIIACAFGLYNLGSLKVAINVLTTGGGEVSALGYGWTALISAVIFTTMHVQDLKDVVGDAARGRRSAPLVLGRRAAGWTIAFPILVWSGACPLVWGAPLWVSLAAGVLGAWVAWRCVSPSPSSSSSTTAPNLAERRTWQLWCAWTALLYLIPPLSSSS
jgi:4-hydroxybenzoate polyprenyltransferase